MRSTILVLSALLANFVSPVGFSQNRPAWDDPVSAGWPADCRRVEIVSSLDGKTQPAMFLTSSGNKSRPLVVSLHTWSGGYDQKDTLVWQCIEKNYNYIHPHFRGWNNNPEACGSPEAIRDIDDAISYSLKNASVDISNIHIIGSSGGGYATMLAYMNSTHNIRTFSAWVGISDLFKWYYESEGRGNNYSRDIANATNEWKNMNEEHYSLGKEEAIKRSPYYMKTPVEKRKDSKLWIYAGIHDGYTGSVPVTQSLFFYNKVVKEFDASESEALIPDQDIIELVSSRNFVNKRNNTIGNRLIHYEKSYKDKIRLVIFEGGHEMLSDIALDHISSKRGPTK
jgi:predicted peptidase